MSFIRIENVSKTYYKKNKPVKEALKNVSFELYEGEVIGLLGVNGAGKTTLSSILASLHPPTEGDVLWKDTSIYRQLIPYRKTIGFCPQNPNLDKTLSVEETLHFSARCYGLSKQEATERKELLLDQFGLKSYAESLAPHLSGGYRQRFLIARTLMHNPKLVILDEPTVGLDPHVRRQIWDLISDLRKAGTTVLLTTHYLDEAEVLSDRVCLIHDGVIRTVDTPENLKRHHKKNNLEEVFLTFVDDPDAEIFKSGTSEESENVD